MSNEHLQLWAKSNPYHDLWRHLLDVAAVVENLWPRFATLEKGPLEEMPPSWACYLCALHDVGKADAWFQNKDDELAARLRAVGINLPPRLDTTPEEKLYFRHERRSQEWLRGHLRRYGWGSEAGNTVRMAIGWHHGTFGESPYRESDKQAALWNPMREELAQLAWDVLAPPPSYAPQAFQHAGAVGMTLSGLLVLADWIASNHEIFDYRKLDHINAAHEYSCAARGLAKKTVRALRLDAVEFQPQSALSFRAVWPLLTRELRPSQRTLEERIQNGGIAPGLAILEAPMGEGKTEAAIYLAEHWNARRGSAGAYLALPTQATSNQMHERYRKYLEVRRPGDEARLVHGMAWLLDDIAPEHTAQTYGDQNSRDEEQQLSREWFRPLRRALLASDGVGTVDQALMAGLHVKFGALRLLGLKTKVLIVDEAHAYDEYMSAILQRLLMWCRALEIPVILLSATLSRRQKIRLVEAYGGDARSLHSDAASEPYPLLSLVGLNGVTSQIAIARDPKRDRTLRLQPHHGLLDDPEAIARLALERIAKGGCACVLMNTVKGAQSVFRAAQKLLREDDDALKPLLFHARFRGARRTEIEAQISAQFGKDATAKNGERPHRALVIATQVIEQSLDVDFDFFITQIAPIDLLLQRSGRLWRHTDLLIEERPRFGDAPVLEILLPPDQTLQFGVSEKVYAREILLRTLATLHGRESVELPQDFRPLIEAVYGDTIPESPIVAAEIIAQAAAEHEKERRDKEGRADEHLLPPPDRREFDMSTHARRESDESEGANHLRASTRLSDDSRPALLLRDPKHLELALAAQTKSDAPKRAIQKAFFLQKVNVPGWWLRDKESAADHQPLFEGQGWLRHHIIIPLRGDEWRSQRGAVIRDDEELGVFYNPTAETDASNVETQKEADAGYTS